MAAALGLIAGTAIGLVAAYARNALDEVLMRLMDVIMALPQIMLALVAVAIVGPHAWVIVAAIALTTAPRIARVAIDGMRFVVPVPSLMAKPNRKYFGPKRGMTFLKHDQ